MGEVIRKDAAAADIVADARTTLTNARARGGDWQAGAEARLGPVVTLADRVQAQLAAAEAAVGPAAAQLAAADRAADALLNRAYDEIWNDVGRPGSDPALDILFPGGASYYAEGPTDDQPDRMTLLADLLEQGIHPRLPAERAAAFAHDIRQSAAGLRELVEATRPLRTRVQLARRMQSAIARSTHLALANLKRHWKADGHSEAEIHAVIPDRPASRPAAAGATAGDPIPA